MRRCRDEAIEYLRFLKVKRSALMEFTGLLVPYRVNRPLTEQERAQQLKQKVRLNLQPLNQLSVIAMNSTYLESVDKWFAWRGAISAVAIISLVIVVWICGGMGVLSLLEAAGLIAGPEGSNDESGFMWIMGTMLIVFGTVLAWCSIWLLRKESFAYTHYPMRFNRKNRMVHVFQTDGTTLTVPWDEIFFTIGRLGAETEVRGHVLDTDGMTVRATFALSFVSVMSARDNDPRTDKFSDQDYVRSHWEFIRRYMEDGPQAVIARVKSCMPVDGRRERAIGGARRILANFAGGSLPLLFVVFPFCVTHSLFRSFAMRTSKIPRWPKDIEDVCTIDPNDPFAIRGDADGGLVAVFPGAARAAGVRFVAPSRTNAT
jgi:hypothetical protein